MDRWVGVWMNGWKVGYTDVCLEGWVDRYPVYKEKISQTKKEGSKKQITYVRFTCDLSILESTELTELAVF
jgi:hypothetical protein